MKIDSVIWVSWTTNKRPKIKTGSDGGKRPFQTRASEGTVADGVVPCLKLMASRPFFFVVRKNHRLKPTGMNVRHLSHCQWAHNKIKPCCCGLNCGQHSVTATLHVVYCTSSYFRRRERRSVMYTRQEREKERDIHTGCRCRPQMMNLSVADCMPTSPVSRGYERSTGADGRRRVGRGQRQMHFESHNVAARRAAR